MASVTEPVIIVQGGAGGTAISDSRLEEVQRGIKDAVRAGYALLQEGKSALDAVEAAVCRLEDHENFNAGRGSSLTSEETVEMDAVIMCGKTMEAGGVAAVQNIRNPITLARKVKEKTDHVLLVGEGANQFAEKEGIPRVDMEYLKTDRAVKRLKRFKADRNFKEILIMPPDLVLHVLSTVIGSNYPCLELIFMVPYVFEPLNFGCMTNLSEAHAAEHSGGVDTGSHDTVGAVAMDKDGNLAFATSTGGITGKIPGRVGDSPIIGAGGYADNDAGAVSTTGDGESFMKMCVAHQVITLMRLGFKPEDAANMALKRMNEKVGGSGGLIALSNKGEVATVFISETMPWACVRHNVLHYGFYADEDYTENL